ARSASPHLFTLARTLDAATPHPETSTGGISTVLHDLAERLGHRQMVIVISDLFDNTEKLLQAFHHLRHKRHEVILLQIIADDELTFPFRSFTLFENLETRGRRNGGGAQKLRLDPATVRGDYLANLSRHLKAIRDEANTLRISHALFKTTDSLEKSLTTYLAQRMGSR
ncbi:MAG: hypothetical protein FWD61_19690, partial [Phycisphaerales bacterium]|nr:hypothetical protein [Phycisphaerales bacterium]